MGRFAMGISFAGKAYSGWQRQENAHAVQAEIENALGLLFRAPVELTGCCRTDTGVNARLLVAHFDTDKADYTQWKYRLNAILPKDIAIKWVRPAADHFHARFDATTREYAYYLHFDKDPFMEGKSWQRVNNLDFKIMNAAAALLPGEKEFRCFCKGAAPKDNYTCHVFSANWEYNQQSAVFRIAADRFLRNMVRAIVGTLMDVGLNKISLDEFREILDHGERGKAGNSVPAFGLFLENVSYPETCFQSEP